MTKFRFLFICFALLAMASVAQITEIKVGVNGLTCSACTRSVEMSILRLDFVDSVQMSLENTEGLVFTKKTSPIDFNKIAKTVTDAGFSVRFLEAKFSLQNITVNENGCFNIGGNSFQWIGFDKSDTQPTLTFIDAPFLSGKEYSKWKKKFSDSPCGGQPVFHVTHVAD